MFTDTASGTLDSRPHLYACLDYLRARDTLAVWKLDRVGRRPRPRSPRRWAARAARGRRRGLVRDQAALLGRMRNEIGADVV